MEVEDILKRGVLCENNEKNPVTYMFTNNSASPRVQ